MASVNKFNNSLLLKRVDWCQNGHIHCSSALHLPRIQSSLFCLCIFSTSIELPSWRSSQKLQRSCAPAQTQQDLTCPQMHRLSVNSMDCWVVSDSCWVAERLLNGCPTVVVVVVRFGFVIKGSQFRCCHLVKIGTESLSLLEVLYSALPRWQTFSWLLPDGYHGYPQTLGVSGPYRSISDVSDFSQMSLM